MPPYFSINRIHARAYSSKSSSFSRSTVYRMRHVNIDIPSFGYYRIIYHPCRRSSVSSKNRTLKTLSWVREVDGRSSVGNGYCEGTRRYYRYRRSILTEHFVLQSSLEVLFTLHGN